MAVRPRIASCHAVSTILEKGISSANDRRSPHSLTRDDECLLDSTGGGHGA